jgi:hypothetical protein
MGIDRGGPGLAWLKVPDDAIQWVEGTVPLFHLSKYCI